MMERWDAEETLALIDEHRVTHLHLVPDDVPPAAVLPAEVRERYDVSSLLAIVHGAAPCPVPVKQAIIEWFGPIVHEYYSATEGYGTGVDSPTWLTKPGTVGRADPDHLYVGDPDGEPLPAGEEGLVWIKATGKARFEYFGDDDKTGSAYRGDFFTLGDVGRVDEDGFLFLTDRSANLIISGGVNIYPAEIDAVLLTHPAVADVGTIGIPDDEWGESVLAVVEPKPERRPRHAPRRAARVLPRAPGRLQVPARRRPRRRPPPRREREALQAPAARRVPRSRGALDRRPCVR